MRHVLALRSVLAMAKFQSPLLGYNNNVRHKNRVFHIQTEDSGVNHPHIITHLFMDGGRILKSVKKSYAEHVGVDGMQEIVRGLMKEQHKAIFVALRDGQFDALVDGGTTQTKPKPQSSPAIEPPITSTSEPSLAVVSAPVIPLPPASDPVLVPAPPSSPDLVVAVAAPPPSPSSSAPIPLVPSPSSSPMVAASPIPPPPSSSREEVAALGKAATIASTPAVVAAAGLAAVIRRIPSSPPPSGGEEVPMTTRQASPSVRPDPSARSARELTLDFDALEQASHDGAPPSLFNASDLPPPPKNLFTKEPGTGGAYRTAPTNQASDKPSLEPRPDARAEPDAAPASKPQPIRTPRAPAARPEGRYAPARPAAIFGSTQRPPPASLFSDDLVSDKSLDEVILSYLAEDLEPPRRK